MFCVIGNMITNGQTGLQLLWRIAVLVFCEELPLYCLFVFWPGAFFYKKAVLYVSQDSFTVFVYMQTCWEAVADIAECSYGAFQALHRVFIHKAVGETDILT